jgi:hypothetical protein
VTFEAVTGFVVDVSVGNGTHCSLTPVLARSTASIVTPAGNGVVTVNVPANVAQDAVGNSAIRLLCGLQHHLRRAGRHGSIGDAA